MVFEANTRNKTKHTLWKGMENYCARNVCWNVIFVYHFVWGHLGFLQNVICEIDLQLCTDYFSFFLVQGQVNPQWLNSETKWCNLRPPGPNKRPGDTRKLWWRTVSPATVTGRVPSGASWRAGARWEGTTPSSSSQSGGSHNLSETNRTSVLLASFSSREDGKTGTSGRAEKTPENKKTCDHSTIATWTMKKPCNVWTWNQADNFYACVVTSLRHNKTINTVHTHVKKSSRQYYRGRWVRRDLEKMLRKK